MTGFEYSAALYTEEQMTELANQAKELTIKALGDEGLLNCDPVEIAQEYVIVTYKKGRFGQLWDKFRGLDKDKKDTTYLTILKGLPSIDLAKKKKEKE